MNSALPMEDRVMKLEQQRGIAYAINLPDRLVATMEDEIAYRESNKSGEE